MMLSSLAVLALLPAAAMHAESPEETRDPPAQYRKTLIGEKLLGIGLSVGATVLPVAAAMAISDASDNGENERLVITLGMAGLLVGPSVGQFYAGSPGLGVLGIGVRAMGGVLVVAGVAASLSEMFCGMDFGGDHGDNDCGGNDGSGAILAGLLIYGGGTAFSLASIPWAIDRKYARGRFSAWELSPSLTLASGGGIRPGATAKLRF